ncbi:ATP-dependent helicase [Paenibacillus paridis]|uniref:ATP-dependent helicase n=1 Tax=Paenibacillus paridis TaxID=2583376 RepID=UPI00111F88C7|nr:ATP-dependent helicase [Paenibacillus paridis]
MVLQKLINKLTAREQLLFEIEALKTKSFHLDREIKNLSSEKQVLINDIEAKKELILGFQDATEKLRNQNEFIEMQLKNIENQNLVLKETLKLYQLRYGDITNTVINGNQISEWDEDVGFFEHIEKIKGNSFNKEQVEAIRYDLGKNLRIIAGAGSGKTETICAKTAYLITMENVEATKICMVTFTRKAADEMKERVNKFLSSDNSRVSIGTFHSIFKIMFEQLLKEIPSCASVGVTGNKTKDSEDQAKRLLNELIKKYKLYQFNKEGDKNIKERIEYWTNLGYSSEEMRDFVAKHFDSIESMSEYPISQRFYDLYHEFIEIRTTKRIVLFDDFLLNLYRAMEKFETAREFIKGKFDYLFVDEFQDINPLQMDILMLIAPPDGSGAKLIIVGDDDQSIYAFRGSDPKYIKNFQKTYNTYTLELMTNYRSKQNIVHAGNRVIQGNAHDRIEKAMEPFHLMNGDAYILAAKDQSSEANWIITKAQEIGKTKPFIKNEILEPINYTLSTVLYRSVSQLQSAYQALDDKNIPYVIESNEDLMGIFNIFDFKISFNKLLDLLESSPLVQIEAWQPFLLNVANAHYISNQSFNRFMKDNQFSSIQLMLQGFVNYVKQEKRKVDSNLLQQFLNGIFKVLKGTPVEVIEFIEPLLKFPKNKENISTEEVFWITTECQNYKEWSDFLSYYHRLKGKLENMKKQLIIYQKGELNALYFLTIHKSKGLAFDNVFVMGVYAGGLPHHKSVPLSKINMDECKEMADPPTSVEEERRLMYVATTRAKYNLYVTFPRTIQDRPSKRSPFIKELGLSLIND